MNIYKSKYKKDINVIFMIFIKTITFIIIDIMYILKKVSIQYSY